MIFCIKTSISNFFCIHVFFNSLHIGRVQQFVYGRMKNIAVQIGPLEVSIFDIKVVCCRA